MNSHRWRLVLSASNLFLAMFLLYLGQREHVSLVRSPGAFYEGLPEYIPIAQKLSYCLNIPSMAATAPLRHSLDGRFVIEPYHVTYGQIIYYVAVFLFWWWVGSKLDHARLGTDPLWLRSRRVIILVDVIGSLFALLLIYSGITGLLGTFSGGKGIVISMVLWGVVLLYYFGRHLVWRARPRPSTA